MITQICDPDLIDALKGTQLAKLNQELKYVARYTNALHGAIVASFHLKDAEEWVNTHTALPTSYWAGDMVLSFGGKFQELPKVFVSIKAAQKRADKLNVEMQNADRFWFVCIWTHPDIILGRNPLETYLKMDGFQYTGSVRK